MRGGFGKSHSAKIALQACPNRTSVNATFSTASGSVVGSAEFDQIISKRHEHSCLDDIKCNQLTGRRIRCIASTIAVL